MKSFRVGKGLPPASLGCYSNSGRKPVFLTALGFVAFYLCASVAKSL